MGGQIPNNLAVQLETAGIPIRGTSAKNIDAAEDRHKFSALLDKLAIGQPEWRELINIKDAESFAERVGYPVLVRPSYVLSGAAMAVASNHEELGRYLSKATRVSRKDPVVISKFVENAKELEFDAVASGSPGFQNPIARSSVMQVLRTGNGRPVGIRIKVGCATKISRPRKATWQRCLLPAANVCSTDLI
jgi:carbamoylphosphate synthase large subunit